MRWFHVILFAWLSASSILAAPTVEQPAPNFTLLGACAPSLGALRDRARVVILFAPAGKALGIQGMKWNAQRQFLEEAGVAAGLAQRQVVVVVVSDGKEAWPRDLTVVRPAGDAAKIRADYHVGEGQCLAVLVGVSGNVNKTSAQP